MKTLKQGSEIDVGFNAEKKAVHPIVGYSIYSNAGGGFHDVPIRVELEINCVYLRQLVLSAAHAPDQEFYDGPLTVRILEDPLAKRRRERALTKNRKA